MKKYFVLVILFLASCSPIIKAIYGVKNPDFESINNQNQFLKKHSIYEDYFIFSNAENYLNFLKNKQLTVPDATFFNADGFMVDYKDDAKTCNANVDEFISKLKHFNELPYNKSINIKDITKLLYSPNNKKIETNEIVVILTWAIFVGRTNKTKTFEWVKLLENAKKDGIKINYYLINCDLQEFWNLNDDQKSKLKKVFSI